MVKGSSTKWLVPGVILLALCLGVFWHQAPKLVNRAIEYSLETVVADVIPSVVHIMYESNKEDYYGQKIRWQGSGVIIHKNGLILTARHVCEDPGKFIVTLADGREFVTRKACVSKEYDVGYLKLDDANDLHVAKFGDSDRMKLGSRILAIGSPWGKQHFNSVTLGILSALNRDRDGSDSSWGWEILFQTDVAANPGNSGGPVFNMDGEVVGIVVGMFGPGCYAGITYCVPSNVCKSLVETVQLTFALHVVGIVEVDKRLDAFEDQLESLWDDLYDVERRIDDIEYESTESEEHSWEEQENENEEWFSY